MPLLRRLLRLPLLLFHVALGVVVINTAVALDRLFAHGGLARWAQVFWCRSLCALLGVRVRIAGEPMPAMPVLIAANHVSWLDILVVASYWDVSFLSKAEVRDWPGVGSVAAGLGTLFIQRGKRDASAQTIRLMAGRLEAGRSVLFFPEGTTSEGEELLPFRPRLFQAAIDADAVVQPLAIRYSNRHDGLRNTVAPFVGNRRLLAHVIELAAEPGIDVLVTLGCPVQSRNRSRNELALLMRDQVGAGLHMEEQPLAAGESG